MGGERERRRGSNIHGVPTTICAVVSQGALKLPTHEVDLIAEPAASRAHSSLIWSASSRDGARMSACGVPNCVSTNWSAAITSASVFPDAVQAY
jgi:hypothetical protein